TSLLFGGRPSPSQSEGTEKATQLERGDNSQLNMGSSSSSSNAEPELAIDAKRNTVQFVAAADLRAENATDKDPDSLYAWMVIFACLISLMLSIGINDAYGVYQQHYQLTEFPNATTAIISWIGTTQFLVMCVGGILSGFLCEHFDTRVMNAVGAIIMGAALIAGSFCKSVEMLMLTQGLLYGVGASFPFVAGTSIPAQWFTKRRGLATGIALSGSGLGGMWMTSAT
ncbi:hypothetical protein GGF44_006153, partial [Coemansia sp. RSA 1694]